MLILDTHTHIYSTDEASYPPVAKPLRPPGDAGSILNLERVTKANGVAGVCIVQTSTFYGWDNRFICDTALKTQRWTAGVCTLDPDDPHSPGLIQHYVKKYGIRALRSVPARDHKLDSPGVMALWKACVDSGIVVNVLCDRDNADALAHMLEKFPRHSVVIDHCLNFKAGSEQDAILADMLRLAKYTNAHAKLTFLATGSAEPYPFRDMHEPCRKIIAAYTPDRCVWGSDFPCELWTPKSTYSQNLRLFTEQQLGLGTAAKEAILGKTARHLYFRGKLG
jgi:predicted TIM-barrel fold metal-dependent hydrolase